MGQRVAAAVLPTFDRDADMPLVDQPAEQGPVDGLLETEDDRDP
jgi:hypothetical protein